MTTFNQPFLCLYCKHLERQRDFSEGVFCSAFPEGVPLSILDNEADHRQPVEGDNGIQFEQDALMPTAPIKDIFAVQ